MAGRLATGLSMMILFTVSLSSRVIEINFERCSEDEALLGRHLNSHSASEE